MKIGFFAFTGTGNTLRVCKILVNELEQNDVICDIKLIKDITDLQVLNDYDKIIIAYPVHGFNTPMPMLNFIKSLPKNDNNKSVYIVRVSGEPLSTNHSASIVPKRILKRKGYVVSGEFAYVMPYNIIFHHTDNMASRMENAAKSRAQKDAQTIINNDGRIYKN
ncbi:MAG: flavodoxin family protein, partial [Clostridia bacterium]|nr:flavodoxin family protein [Clostridia bacterium]